MHDVCNAFYKLDFLKVLHGCRLSLREELLYAPLPSAPPFQLLSGEGIFGFHNSTCNQVYKPMNQGKHTSFATLNVFNVGQACFPAIVCYFREFWLVNFIVCFCSDWPASLLWLFHNDKQPCYLLNEAASSWTEKPSSSQSRWPLFFVLKTLSDRERGNLLLLVSVSSDLALSCCWLGLRRIKRPTAPVKVKHSLTVSDSLWWQNHLTVDPNIIDRILAVLCEPS